MHNHLIRNNLIFDNNFETQYEINYQKIKIFEPFEMNRNKIYCKPKVVLKWKPLYGGIGHVLQRDCVEFGTNQFRLLYNYIKNVLINSLYCLSFIYEPT